MAKRPIYAERGDVVTCESGHPICVFSRTVHEGDLFDPDDLVAWRQPAPAPGLPIPRCWCGSRWALPGNRFHFWDGWRSVPPLPLGWRARLWFVEARDGLKSLWAPHKAPALPESTDRLTGQ